ncbi:MAG: hypothetical protein LH617_14970 [Ramlibacter sp.]|nr:hypothetical protein [Ramlibacter sp.]
MSKPKAAAPALVDKSRLLQVTARPGVSEDRLMADVATAGIASNASTAIAFMRHEYPGLSLTDIVRSLQEQGRRVNGNDFAQQEQMLNAQSNALNAVFAELCRRAALNIGEYPEATERYLRLAFRAQSQCRATVETLAAIKNPPVFTRQANIAHGPQQVNNGAATNNETNTRTHAPAHGKTEIEPTKLLAEDRNGSTLMDAGTAAKAARGNPAVEAVGAVHRPTKRRGKGEG